MADALNRDEEDLLQSALETAFQPAPLPRVSAAPAASSSSSSAPPSEAEPSSESDVTASVSSLESSSLEDSWKAEYEEHVAEWKAKNAEQRAKAEEKRKEWEEIREKEKAEGKSDDRMTESEWIGVGGDEARGVESEEAAKGSPADARDLVTGEGQGGKTKEYLESILPGAPSSSQSSLPEIVSHSRLTSEHDSKHEKWEEVSSELTSSFPSVSFPSDPHSPSSSQHQPLHPHSSHHDTHHSHHHSQHSHQHRHGHEVAAAATVSPTMAIFDSSLSTKTRVMALTSSLAINLLLPFVNGVMLGFGEIFARNVVVGWFGWKVPDVPETSRGRAGRVATTVGVGIAKPSPPSK